MRGFILTCSFFFLSTILLATPPVWLWATRTGQYGDNSRSITIDAQGNHYITGEFRDTTNFGTTTLHCEGIKDIYVAKLDRNGNWLWAAGAGGVLEDFSSSIAIDVAGNVYVTGCFRGTASFGNTQLSSIGFMNVFVAKLDMYGNWLWAKQTEGTSLDNFIIRSRLVIDDTNCIYLTGYYTGTMTIASFPPLSNSGNTNLFIAKLDSAGNWLWAKSANCNDATSSGIALGRFGVIHLVGNFVGTIIFDTIQLNSSSLHGDLFAAKLDRDGNWLWAKRISTCATDYIYCSDHAVDNEGNMCFTGSLTGTASIGSFSLTSSSFFDSDIFVAKLDSLGNVLWANRAGGASGDKSNALTVDNYNSVYITGSFSGIAGFDNMQLTSSGSSDLFIAKLSCDGYWIWTEKAGGMSSDLAYDIVLDNADNAIITGSYNSTTGLGPGSLTVNGTGDIFVAKLFTYAVDIEDDVLPAINGLSLLYDAFPNPGHKDDKVCIKADICGKESGMLSLYNVKGQLIKSYRVCKGLNQVYINKNELSPGIYIYNLKTPTTNISKKLSIMASLLP